MRMVADNASYGHRVKLGRYLRTRLARAGYQDLAGPIEQAAAEVKAKGRAWEDQEESLQDALALRNAADDELDHTAREVRLALVARSLSAVREAPFTSVFPAGLDYYTAAPLAEEQRRYGELFQRLEQHLAAGDPVRTQHGPAVTAGIEAFRSGVMAVEQARTASSLAQTALDVAEESFDRLVEKVYAALIDRTGRKAAERFFPKPARRKSRPEADPQDTTAPEA